MPERIQLRRTKGWRLPEGAISVARPTRWGNPFVVGATGLAWHGGLAGEVLHYGERECWADHTIPGVGLTAKQAVALYRTALEAIIAPPNWPNPHQDDIDYSEGNVALLRELRGHDLACWCKLSDPCHADVLLELANA